MSLARATGFARERGTLEKPKLRVSVCACLWAWVWVGAGVALGDTLSLSIFLSLSLSLSLGVYVVVWAWVQLWRQRQHGTVVASVACESVSACVVMKYKCLYGGVVFTRPAPLRRRLPPRSVVTPPMFRGYTPPPMEGVTTEQGEIPPRTPHATHGPTLYRRAGGGKHEVVSVCCICELSCIRGPAHKHGTSIHAQSTSAHVGDT